MSLPALKPGDRLALVPEFAPPPPRGVAAWPLFVTIKTVVETSIGIFEGASLVEIGGLYHVADLCNFYLLAPPLDLDAWRETLDE